VRPERGGAAAAHALDDGVVGHVDLQHVVELDAGGLHGVGLRDGAREAVEQEAVGAVGLGDALLDQADDDVVADQRAGVHHLLGGQAQRRAGLDGGAQHVAGGDLRDAVFLADEGRLACPCRRRGRPDRISLIAPLGIVGARPLPLCEKRCAAFVQSRIACATLCAADNLAR
jgi:hypothetical protein